MIHSSAIVHDDADIGENTHIWHWTHVREGAQIGANVVIGQNVYVASDVVIGDGCRIQNNVSVYDNVTLERDVFCGPSMVFTNVRNPRAHIERKDEFEPTVVRRGATLGANCTIVCGVEIGPYAFIGAGTVVVRDVPAFALMVGNPAKQKGWMCQCGERLPDANQMECKRCGSQYVLDAGKLTWVVDAP